jgi:hypothetical protein
VAGDLADLPVGTLRPVLILRGKPGVLGRFDDRSAHRLGQVVADQEADLCVTAEVQKLVARAGAVDAQQQFDRLDVLGGDLRDGLLGNLDLVGGSVRSGVAGPQLSSECFAGLVRIGEHRVKPVAALEIPRRALLLGMRRDQRRVQIDRQPLRRPRDLPHVCSRRSVSGAQPLKPLRVTRDPSNEPRRGRRRRNITEQRRLITKCAEVGQAVAAVGKHHREIPDHTAQIMSSPAHLQARKLARKRPRQPGLLSDLPQQRGPRMRHQTRSVRHDIYREKVPIAYHLQGDPPKLDLQAPITRRIAARANSQAAPTNGAASASCTIYR